MNVYKTAEVAAMIGIHPNTVRLYEQSGLIPPPERRSNGYRVFTDVHIAHFRLARLAFQIEILQNGLRQQIVEMVKVAAKGDYDTALQLTHAYLSQIQQEQRNAEEAIDIVTSLLSGQSQEMTFSLKRKEVSEYLNISMDALRNWEMNGLLTIKRRENGYRVYTDEDIQRLKIIRSLRCANYSLEAILRMLNELSANPHANIGQLLNTPRQDDDIISVCDKLISSLQAAEANARTIIDMLQNMKSKFQSNKVST